MRDFIQKIKKLFGLDKENPDGKKRLSPKLKKLLLIGVPILAASICVVLVLVLQNPSPGVTGANSSGFEGQTVEPEYADNDTFAVALSTGEYAGIILEKTNDAGVDYVKDTLFIGDSNTAGMINYGSTTNVTMKNGIGIVSMGISHVTSLNCVKFSGMSAVPVPQAVQIMQPRRILINYGTNDYYMTPEKFAETYKNALDAIHDAYPYSDIIIGSIFPITSNCSYYTVSMPTIEKFNLELVKVAQEKGVRFLNWSEALKDPATGYCKSEYMAGDGVHLSKKGMEQISNYFRTHKLDGDDKRPKPLNPVPVREPTPVGLLGVGLPTEENDEPKPEPVANQGLVTVTFSAGTGGSVSGGGSYSVAPGSTVGPVTAQPQTGYRFVGWTGAVSSSSASITFTVPANAEAGKSYAMTAVFEAIGGSDPNAGQNGSGGQNNNGGQNENTGTPGDNNNNNNNGGTIVDENNEGTTPGEGGENGGTPGEGDP